MAGENDLTFILKMKDEASQALKSLQSSINQIGVSVEAVTGTTAKHTVAVKENHAAIKDSSDALREASYASRILGAAHGQLAEKLTESARELRGLLPLFKEFGEGGLLVAGALAIVGTTVIENVAAFARFERQGLLLNAVLRSVGEVGKTSMAQIHEESEKLARSSIFDPEQIDQVGLILAKNNKTTAESIKELTPLVLDFAAQTQTSTADAATMVSTIVQNPMRALMLMQRQIRTITPEIQKQIRDLIDTGHGEEASNKLLEQMTLFSKGADAALTKGVAGGWGLAWNAATTYFENNARWWGEDIASATHLGEALHWVASKWGDVNEAQGKARAVHDAISGLSPGTQAAIMAAGAPSLPGYYARQGITSIAQAPMSAGGGQALPSHRGPNVSDIYYANFEGLRAQAMTDRGATGSASAREFSLQGQTDNYNAAALKWLDQNAQEIHALENAHLAVEGLTVGLKDARLIYGDTSIQAKDMGVALGNATDHLHSLVQGLALFSLDATAAAHKASLAPGDAALNDAVLGAAKAAHPNGNWRAHVSADLGGTASSTDTDLIRAGQAERNQMVGATTSRSYANYQADHKDEIALASAKGASHDMLEATINLRKYVRDTYGDAGPRTPEQLADVATHKQMLTGMVGVSEGAAAHEALVNMGEGGRVASAQAGLYVAGATSAEVKAQGEAIKFALDMSKAGTMGYSDALAKALPIIRERMLAEDALKTAEANHANVLASANAQGMRDTGNRYGGMLAQWRAAARDAGLTGGAARASVDSQNAAYQGKQTDALVGGTVGLNQDTSKKNAEAATASLSAMNAQIQTQMYDLQALRDQGQQITDQDWNARAEAITRNAEATQRLREANGPLNQAIKEGQDTWKMYQEGAVTALNDTENAFSSVISKSATMHSALVTLLNDFASLAANAAFKQMGSLALTAIGGMLGGPSTAGVGVGGVEPLTGLLAGPHALGGVFSNRGEVPLQKYSNGGIATSPQLALFGEGRGPEAYVPLPDGRSIPVSMKGGRGGGSQTNNQTNHINVTVEGGGGGSGGQGGGGGDPSAVGTAVAASLKVMMVGLMQDQMRSGGALNPFMG